MDKQELYVATSRSSRGDDDLRDAGDPGRPRGDRAGRPLPARGHPAHRRSRGARPRAAGRPRRGAALGASRAADRGAGVAGAPSWQSEANTERARPGTPPQRRGLVRAPGGGARPRDAATGSGRSRAAQGAPRGAARGRSHRGRCPREGRARYAPSCARCRRSATRPAPSWPTPISSSPSAARPRSPPRSSPRPTTSSRSWASARATPSGASHGTAASPTSRRYRQEHGIKDPAARPRARARTRARLEPRTGPPAPTAAPGRAAKGAGKGSQPRHGALDGDRPLNPDLPAIVAPLRRPSTPCGGRALRALDRRLRGAVWRVGRGEKVTLHLAVTCLFENQSGCSPTFLECHPEEERPDGSSPSPPRMMT